MAVAQEDAVHLSRVLRVRAGEGIELLDGQGLRASGTIAEVGRGQVRVRVSGVRYDVRHEVKRVLAVGLLKNKAMDLLVQKATELGVDQIVPLLTEHCEVKLKDAERVLKKYDHLQVVAREACKQSGNAFLPAISEPMRFDSYIEGITVCADLQLIYGALRAGSRPLTGVMKNPARTRVMVVGPEGDFSESEYALLEESGAIAVSLGSNVLRAETAGLYFLAVADAVSHEQ